MLQIQGRIFCIVFPDEILYRLILFKHHAPPLLVAGEKTIESHDNGQLHLLRNFQSANIHVVDRLRRICKKDDPACIQAIHDIAMVALDTQRSGDCSTGYIHHHREPCPRLDRQLFQGIQQPIGTGGIKHSPAAGGCPIADACRTMLPFRGDHADLMFPVSLHLVEKFGNLGRRRDGVIAHHVIIDLFRCIGRHFVATFK